MQQDIVSVVEAAYRLDDDEPYLRGVLESVRPHLDRGLGVFGFFLDASDLDAVRVTTPMLLSGPPGSCEVFSEIESALQLAPDRQRDLGMLGPMEVAQRVWGRSQCVIAASQALGEREWSQNPAVKRWLHPIGVEDALGLKILDVSRRGLFVGAATPKTTRPGIRTRMSFARVAAHLATGDRLRRAMRRRPGSLDDAQGTIEAVLRPDGTIEHATGPAKTRSAMQALREQAVAIDRARGPMRRTDPDEALRAWQALVSGRWTLLDHFDRDGRRYFIARRNEASIDGPVGLSPRERQVLGWAALGHPSKLIAYELGLERSTVATHLSSAVRKLGLRSRAELSQLFGGLARAVSEASDRACPEPDPSEPREPPGVPS